jgi:STAM-binding protein
VQQRQQLEEEARRQEMMASSAALKPTIAPKVLPQPPDLTFSRPSVQMPPPGPGSQSTVVLMDGQGQGRGPVDVSRNNQQEQMRQREEEITRKRREEQEGIARRQYESEEASRAARQNLAAPSLPYPPQNSISPPSSAPHTFSLFPTHPGASSSSVPKSMFYPTAVQYPKLGPTAMPLESPHYEGDSTDSESLHHDFRRLRMDSNNQRSPLKAVRR